MKKKNTMSFKGVVDALDMADVNLFIGATQLGLSQWRRNEQWKSWRRFKQRKSKG